MLSPLLLFCAFMAFGSAAHAQDCTGPNGVIGDIIYNNTYDVFQGCSTLGWMAFHAATAPDLCTTSPTPGTPCADGQTVYAGSWNGSRYYTTVADQSTGAYWGAYNVSLGAVSSVDGLTNTNTALAYLDANPQAGACNTAPRNPPACVSNALVLCRNLRSTLGGDWYLPANLELLQVLWTNKDAIGGFSDVSYISSTWIFNMSAGGLAFPSGISTSMWRDMKTFSVRCVRRE